MRMTAPGKSDTTRGTIICSLVAKTQRISNTLKAPCDHNGCNGDAANESSEWVLAGISILFQLLRSGTRGLVCGRSYSELCFAIHEKD